MRAGVARLLAASSIEAIMRRGVGVIAQLVPADAHALIVVLHGELSIVSAVLKAVWHRAPLLKPVGEDIATFASVMPTQAFGWRRGNF